MSLTKCPECELQVSDKALTCPHCGFPLSKPEPLIKSHRKKHNRLPNGFGRICKLNNPNLRNPYRAMVTVGTNNEGRPIVKLLKPQSYFATYNDAYAALIEYNKNPFDFDSCMTVEKLYGLWSDKYFENITASSKRTITSAWAYCTEIYNMQVRDLRVRHIKFCMGKASDKPNTANRIKSMFNLMLDYGVENEILEKNYARDFKIEKIEVENPHSSFTKRDIEMLWEHADMPFICFVLIQTYMGWRPQELCNLEMKNIDLVKREIIGGMKTKAGKNRVVPICDKIYPVLNKIYTLSSKLDSQYLCCSPDGTHMTYDMYQKRFKSALQNIGLPEHKAHDPRKTFITICKHNDVNEYAIKKMVGHNISDITEAVYTDRDPNWLHEEAKKIKGL